MRWATAARNTLGEGAMPTRERWLLGNVVAVKAGLVQGMHRLEARLVLLRKRLVRVAIEMVEDAESHTLT